MKYKIGDRVKIKSLDWYNEHKNETDDIECSNNIWFYREMSKFCGKVMTISHVRADHYTMVEDLVGYWTDEMIERKVEEETKSHNNMCKQLIDEMNPNVKVNVKTKPEPKFKVGEIVYSITWQRDIIILDILPDGFYKVGDVHLGWFRTDESGLCKEKITLPTDSQLKKPFKQEISLPEGYQFVDENDNVINTNKIVLEKKKKEYPKTYEECAEIIAELTGSDCNPKGCMGYMSVQLTALQKLLICRDAYWKIAGEEMGLGKPWEPDWEENSEKSIITKFRNTVAKFNTKEQHTFAFPTEEMRDAFKENFDPDIEICKIFL